MLHFPAIEELGQRLRPQAGSSGIGQPRRQPAAAALSRRAHCVTEIRIERNTQLVYLHTRIIPWWDVPWDDASGPGAASCPSPLKRPETTWLRLASHDALGPARQTSGGDMVERLLKIRFDHRSAARAPTGADPPAALAPSAA